MVFATRLGKDAPGGARAMTDQTSPITSGGGRGSRLDAAHILSLTRLVLAPAWLAALDGPRALPLGLALLACASDFFDGRLARRARRVAREGRVESAGHSTAPLPIDAGALLDVAADGAFLIVTLAGAAQRGWLSPLLPLAAATALLALALRWRGDPPRVGPTPGRQALADRLGHTAGVVNYGAVLAASTVPLGLIAPVLLVPASLVVAALNALPVALRLSGRGT